MKKNVDALIVVPNERIKELKSSNITIMNAFEKVDEILCKAVMGIISLIHQTGYLNIDFADICSTLRESGIAHMAIGSGKGEKKVEEAIEEVMNSPLLETSISGARRGLLNVSLPESFELDEFDSLMKKITENFDTEASAALFSTSRLKRTRFRLSLLRRISLTKSPLPLQMLR